MSVLCAVDGCRLRTLDDALMCEMHEQARRDSDAATASAVARHWRTAQRCDVCGEPLTSWQRRRHFTCCARVGGREPMCNPVAKIWYDDDDNGYRPCAACWRLGSFLGKRPKPKPATTKRKSKRGAA